MKYYLFKIFYNKVAQAEDRPQPQAFTSRDAAEKAYHQYLGQSIDSETCGWVLAMVVNEYGNTELMTRWSKQIPNTHTVTFNSHGGTAVESQTIIDGDTASEPIAPTREDYTFEGWELNGYAYDFSMPVHDDIVLVAQWT